MMDKKQDSNREYINIADKKPDNQKLKPVVDPANLSDEILDKIKDLSIKDAIITVFKTIFDPEIPVDIWELGLIYDLSVDDDNNVEIEMTLTSPMCPVAETLPVEVEAKAKAVPGVKSTKLQLVWDPPWTQEMMSQVAKAELDFFY